MDNSTKGSTVIAVTSQNYRTVTKHAGLCRKLLVYNVQLGEDGKVLGIDEIERISVAKEEALHKCKPSVRHPVDVANVIVCGSCGEGFIRKMGKRDIAVSVATRGDPVEAIEEYLANGERHYTCDGPHQKVVKRHPNCPHNKKHGHTHQHSEGCGCKEGHRQDGGCGSGSGCGCGCGNTDTA